jgi:hypothetical protein
VFCEMFEQRKQVKWYDESRIPDKSIIVSALEDAYRLTASKQNLIPYKVYAVAENSSINQALYNVSQDVLPVNSTSRNYNLLTAPYQFIYTVRLAGGNAAVESNATVGHDQPPMDPDVYKTRSVIKNTNIEIGMHATVLTELLLGHGIDVSYTLCFPSNMPNENAWKVNGLTFLEDEVQFIVSAGYAIVDKYYESPEDKPDYRAVVQWVQNKDIL